TAESELSRERDKHAETRGQLDEALAGLTKTTTTEPEPSLAEYLCFAPGKKGYRLVPVPGAMPRVGDRHELHGTEYVVTRVGRSPLPSDQRRCAYLQAA